MDAPKEGLGHKGLCGGSSGNEQPRDGENKDDKGISRHRSWWQWAGNDVGIHRRPTTHLKECYRIYAYGI
jgi:hypothetical protein